MRFSNYTILPVIAFVFSLSSCSLLVDVEPESYVYYFRLSNALRDNPPPSCTDEPDSIEQEANPCLNIDAVRMDKALQLVSNFNTYREQVLEREWRAMCLFARDNPGIYQSAEEVEQALLDVIRDANQASAEYFHGRGRFLLGRHDMRTLQDWADAHVMSTPPRSMPVSAGPPNVTADEMLTYLCASRI